jgi:hypothetical protein
MKIKYDKEEFLSMHTLGFKLIELAETAVKLHFADNDKRRQYNLDLATKKGLTLHPNKEEEEDDDSDSNSGVDSIWEEADSEAPPEDIHDNQLFDLMKDPSAVKNQPFKRSKGRKVAEELFNTWLINFDQEGEQPDRAELIETLKRTMRGQYIFDYLKSQYEIGVDLTLVVRDIYPTNISDAVVRHVTENFVQVTSILFPNVSDFMKYPNPLIKEEI